MQKGANSTMKNMKILANCSLILSLIFYIVDIVLKLTKSSDTIILTLLGTVCLICYVILRYKLQKNDSEKK